MIDRSLVGKFHGLAAAQGPLLCWIDDGRARHGRSWTLIGKRLASSSLRLDPMLRDGDGDGDDRRTLQLSLHFTFLFACHYFFSQRRFLVFPSLWTPDEFETRRISKRRSEESSQTLKLTGLRWSAPRRHSGSVCLDCRPRGCFGQGSEVILRLPKSTLRHVRFCRAPSGFWNRSKACSDVILKGRARFCGDSRSACVGRTWDPNCS